MFQKFFSCLPALAIPLAVLLAACSREEEPAPVVVIQENDVPNGTTLITYTVHVLPTSESAAKVAGLSGATVSVSHSGGILKVVTDESGIAVFPGIRTGDVSIFIKKDGYLSVNTVDIADCYNCLAATSDSEQIESDQITINVPRLGATLRGTIYGDFDFNAATNNTTIPAGATVIATISNAYQPNVFTAITGSQGEFSFDNLPENVPVNLSINYQSMNNLQSPPVEKDWVISTTEPDNDGPYTLSVYDERALGVIVVQ